MGYGDAFFMLTLFYVGLSALVMLLKKPNPNAAAGGALKSRAKPAALAGRETALIRDCSRSETALDQSYSRPV